jgi:hypothetical protein
MVYENVDTGRHETFAPQPIQVLLAHQPIQVLLPGTLLLPTPAAGT